MLKLIDIKKALKKLEIVKVDKLARIARHQHKRGKNGTFISIYPKNSKCINHPNRPRYCLNLCSNCYYQNVKEYKQNSTEQILKIGKTVTNKLKKEYLKLISLKKKAQKRDYALRKKYGITLEQYEELYEKQHGKCVLCQKRSSKRLSVDHDHRNGKIRGLLCFRCNYGIGYFKEDIKTFDKIINYLRRIK